MNQITPQDEEGILEVMNLIGPGLQQAISNAIVDGEIRLRRINNQANQHSLAPHPDYLSQMLWCQVYAEYIGANTGTGELDYDPAMLHDNAAFHAETAFNAFNKRFKNE